VTELEDSAGRLEPLAQRLGLQHYAVDFELAPASLMTEIAVYGLPIRMPHWSYGVRYIHQLVRQSMGHSKIFEVMFPGDPCRAFLMDSNSLAENTLVAAHVLGHADFSRNNQLFARFHAMAGGNIVEHAAAHAQRIQQAIEAAGLERVEAVLDAALALESHVDVSGELHRPPYPEFVPEKTAPTETAFQKRFGQLPGAAEKASPSAGPLRTRIPPHPEYDLLWFIAHYAPELEQWERDIFLAVRAESLYFYPVFACQIMNEGWASYWHARLLREADFLPQPLYLSAIKAHSDVVRPFASGQQTALAINPYHLGFTIWERIVEKHGIERAREVRRDEDDDQQEDDDQLVVGQHAAGRQGIDPADECRNLGIAHRVDPRRGVLGIQSHLLHLLHHLGPLERCLDPLALGRRLNCLISSDHAGLRLRHGDAQRGNQHTKKSLHLSLRKKGV